MYFTGWTHLKTLWLNSLPGSNPQLFSQRVARINYILFNSEKYPENGRGSSLECVIKTVIKTNHKSILK